MYERYKGDDLLSKDKRLKHKWRWNRVASQIDEKGIKKWTHFQSSYCEINDWKLQVIQWSKGYKMGVDYEASISCYDSHSLVSKKGFKTRLEAQIQAEKLLYKWMKTEFKKLKEAYVIKTRKDKGEE